MKKIYNAPYFKVVEVKNDIIATSIGANPSKEFGEEENVGTQGRLDFFEDDDLY